MALAAGKSPGAGTWKMAWDGEQELESAAGPVAHAAAAACRSDPPCILVADDDDDLREMIALALRAAGYEVVEARTGLQLAACVRRKVVECAASPEVQLIVSDIQMPGCSGLDVLSVMRDVGVRVPVVFITGYGNEAVRAEARRLGVQAVLEKPFELDDLGAAVRALVPPAAGRNP
ncbi:MAG: response regulator [Deltaproteobacteria bacterium]|nr:response regulator [Deltaproteobacteria bacterium]